MIARVASIPRLLALLLPLHMPVPWFLGRAHAGGHLRLARGPPLARSGPLEDDPTDGWVVPLPTRVPLLDACGPLGGWAASVLLLCFGWVDVLRRNKWRA
jgi:hypothetical protein